MTPERWEDVLPLFNAAVERPPDARAAFLAAADADTAVRREVERLLAVYDDDPDYLEAPVGRVPSPPPPATDPDSLEASGARVGPYRLLRRIGTGGMGAVYLAVRDDDLYHKEVAVKLVKRGMDTEEILRRFRAERQILASLEHPHIARLLDGGMTDDGRPYVVMEYVDGIPVGQYCDQRRLSVPERLRLFRTVCAAVQYAHQNLVVHRDLKPSNILVTPGSRPGQAPGSRPGQAPGSRPGQAPGSLNPVQGKLSSGQAPGSLNPVQGKLSSGQAPGSLNPVQGKLSPGQAQGTVKLLDFGIAKLLDPDRSAVTVPLTRTDLRLMTPDYASPEQVRGTAVNTTSDVYQLGVLLYELLTGRRPYRLRGQSTEEIARIICTQDPEKPSAAVRRPTPDGLEPESVAAARAADPERLARRLEGDLDTIVLKAMHKEASRRYASAEAFADDLLRHLNGRPVLARPDTARYRIGKFVRRNRLGVAAAATFVLLLAGFGIVAAWQARALSAERDAARAERDKAEQVVQVLVDLFETSNPTVVPGGDTLRVGDFLARGEAEVLEALETQPDVQARMRHVLGKVYAARGQFEPARRLLASAGAQLDTLAGPESPEALAAFHDLAVLAWQTDDPDAESMLRTSVDRHRRYYGNHHERLAQSLQNLADAVESQDEQEALLQEALGIRRATRADPGGMAAGLSSLAALRYNQKNYDEAIRLWEEARNLLAQTHPESHPYVLTVLQNLAAAYGNQGRLDEAEALRRRVLALTRDVYGPEAPSVGVNLSNLGVLLAVRGDRAGAETAFREALAVWQAALPTDHWRRANDLRNLGIILQHQQRYDEALPYLEEALTVNRRRHGPESPRTGYLQGQYGVLLLHMGRTTEALDHLHTALRLVETSTAAAASSMLADTRLRLALGLLETGAFARAEPLFRQALETRQALYPAGDPKVAEAQCGLGVVLAAGETPEASSALLRRAVPAYAAWPLADALLLAHARRALKE